MAEPTRDDIDALVGPATPHFAYQLRARVRELIEDLPDDHPIRKYGEEKMELLDRLGHASSLARERRPRAVEPDRLGDDPLVGAGVRPAAQGRMTLRGRFGPRDRRVARHRQGDRAPLRVARRDAGRDRLHARRHAGRGDRRRSCARSARSRSSCAGTSPRRASPRRSPSSGRSTCSSTRPRRASSARPSRPRTSTGTGRSRRTRARCSR